MSFRHNLEGTSIYKAFPWRSNVYDIVINIYLSSVLWKVENTPQAQLHIYLKVKYTSIIRGRSCLDAFSPRLMHKSSTKIVG